MEKCLICGNTGIFLKKNPEENGDAEFRICPCIEEICVCGGVKPYYAGLRDGMDVWCECRKYRVRRDTLKRNFLNSQIPKKYRFKFMDSFKVTTEEAAQIIGVLSPLKEAAMPDSQKKGYYLWGEPGGGKTLLACIILQELMRRDVLQGKFVNITSNFFQKIRDSYQRNTDSEDTAHDILDEYGKVSLLVLDDFGVQRNTEWEMEMLYNLLNTRYTEEKLTIITSNYPLEDSKEIVKGRIFSRITEMCGVIEMNLLDYRKKGMQQSRSPLSLGPFPPVGAREAGVGKDN